jgi:hypothetical protein
MSVVEIVAGLLQRQHFTRPQPQVQGEPRKIEEVTVWARGLEVDLFLQRRYDLHPDSVLVGRDSDFLDGVPIRPSAQRRVAKEHREIVEVSDRGVFQPGFAARGLVFIDRGR